MTMSDLAARLALAADDLAGMRAELAAESGFEISGSAAGLRLAAQLTESWRAREEALVRLSGSLAELAANVRLASRRYTTADSTAAASFDAGPDVHAAGQAGASLGGTVGGPTVGLGTAASVGVAASEGSAREVGAEWTL